MQTLLITIYCKMTKPFHCLLYLWQMLAMWLSCMKWLSCCEVAEFHEAEAEIGQVRDDCD